MKPVSGVAIMVSILSAAVCAAADPVAMKAEAFEPKNVRLLDGPFRDAMLRDADYLLKLEADRLLAGFREDAGLRPKAQRYGGWEEQGVAGHTLGHYLSACAKMYAATGDIHFYDRVSYIVDELAACQIANGNGYVAAIPEGKRIFAEIARGDIRSKGFDLNGCWVPWYTMHKLMAGLRDAYQIAGCSRARNVLVGLADWAFATTCGLSDELDQRMLDCEHGGMNEVAADVYAITGDPNHLALARRFNHRAVMDPLAAGKDELNGRHANTQIPKMTGAARQYELTGDKYFHDVAEFFWKTVVAHHTYVIGGNSDQEHFGEPGLLANRLSKNTAETCNTYNMLKLTRRLFMWDAAPERADYYERALFNHILASQDPVAGGVTYYVGMAPGMEKVFQPQFDLFTCCIGTGMENHAQYGDAIYFHDEAGVYVNLFIASELKWEEKGLTLRQETRFPDEPVSRLRLACKNPLDLTFYLRHPAWADRMRVSVNGNEIRAAGPPGRFIPVKRVWGTGDMIEIGCSMALRIEAMPDNPKRAAILYGPIVLAGQLGDPAAPMPIAPVLVTGNRPVAEWLKPVAGERLVFETSGVGRPGDVRMIPFFRTHHVRHAVYWDFFTEEEWKKRQDEYRAEEERRKALEARTIDFVQPGEMQPERDHAMDGENTRCGEHLGRKWRDAADGGRFAFTLKTAPDAPIALIVTYWGSDAGPREFDLLVDGAKIATQKLDNLKPGEFVDITYPIPSELTKDKGNARVTFQAHPGMMAGGVFGCRVVRAE
ncbi:MAG TPA: glycoside hydrolase family 127 protein [Candidatus Hydrogenedentes bacterium]|nr:glycoside hydrolase family 127 protein [Candidatus Hydrogenedentota bacterium]